MASTQYLVFMSKLIVIFASSLVRQQPIIELHGIRIKLLLKNHWILRRSLLDLFDLLSLVDILKLNLLFSFFLFLVGDLTVETELHVRDSLRQVLLYIVNSNLNSYYRSLSRR